MRKLLKSLACFAAATLVGTAALADGLNAGNTLTIGGNTSDWSLWSQSGDSPTDLGYVSDLTVTDARLFWWADYFNDGANMFFTLWDGGDQPVGSWQDVWLGNSTYVGGEYGHDYTVDGPDGGAKDLNSTWGVSLEEGKTYYLDVKVKTYKNGDPGGSWYPSSDGDAYYHAKFTYCSTLQKFVYNLNGGTSCGVMALQLPIGDTYDGAVQAVWADHVFRGWWTADGQTRYQNGKSVVPDNGGEPIELYAHWSDAQVVQFNAGEGATCDPASVTLSQGETYWHFPTPVRDGYKFLGWFTEQEAGTRVKNGDSPVTTDASRELFAHWQAMKVVTLNPTGGECSKTSITRPVGDVYWGLPSAPTKQGCSFQGWFTAETGGTRVRNGDTVNADDPTTLYAQWREWRVVTLDATGGECSKTSITRPVGDVYWGLPSAPTKDGCKFLGWYTAETGGTRVRNGDTVNADDPTTLYAQWKQRAGALAITGFSFASRAAVRDTTANYERISDVSALQDGTYVILTDPDGTYAMPATVSNSVFSLGVSVTPDADDVISTSDASIVWKVVKNASGKIAFYNESVGKYAGHSGANSNAGQLQTDAFYTDVTLVSELFKVTAITADSGNNYRLLQYNYNSGKPRFAYYKTTSNMQNLRIYAKVSEPTPSTDPTVTIAASAETVHVGDPAVTVTATAANFPAGAQVEFTWWVNGSEDEETSDTLTLSTTAEATYEVFVWAIAGDDDAESNTLTIKVQAPHAITVTAGEHGSALADKATAYAGETVTLTVTPASGYTTDTITVNNGAVSVTDNSFTMPDAAAAVSVTFKEASSDVVYTLVESMDDFDVGADYLVVAYSKDKFTSAMKNVKTGNRIDLQEVTIVDNTVTIPADAAYADAIVWNIAAAETEGKYTLYNEAADRYVAFPSSSGDNYADLVADGTSAYAQWTLAIAESTHLATIGSSHSGKALARNSTAANAYFANYSSGTKPYLFKAPSSVPMQTFNYHLNGGDSCEVMTLKLPIGSTYDGAKQAVWAGHVFRGWWTEDGQTRYQNGKSEVPDNGGEPIELYAHWSDAQVVQFNAGAGATCDPASVTLSQGETYWHFPTPVRDGYKFLGWYTSENGGTRVKNGDSPVTTEASRELFAHWQALKVVTLNPTGGECSKTSITRPVGDVYWGLPSAPTKPGCSFQGWFTAETGGTRVRNGDTVNADDPTTLYAQWREWRVVTLNAMGGTCSKESITRPVGDVYWGLPSAPTKEGYKFLGWYTAETGGTRVRNGDTLNADDPTTLYAQWKQRAATLAITGFSMASRTAAPAARSAAGDTVECTLWVNTIATVDYEIYWTDDLTGEWTVLKRWTATDDGETPVTVAIPADSTTGFFRIVELDVE